MPYLVGTDEAGYGPNLGPLVISASVWRVECQPRRADLYQRLARVVCSQPDGERIAIADSKALYKAGGDLGLLERAVLAALAAIDRRPADWWQMWAALEADPRGEVPLLPWHAGFQHDLPLVISQEELDRTAARLSGGLAAAGVRLVAVRSRAVFPAHFNALVEQHGNKATALSQLTLCLLADLLPTLDEPVLVVCDKHGGRNHYQPLLQTLFPDWLVEVYGEARAESTYRWGPPERRVEVCFQARAEKFLPTALASMACKYLRELAMLAFNDFWCCRVPNLRPTAGYPGDSTRFKDEIAAVQRELGIDDRTLWRCR